MYYSTADYGYGSDKGAGVEIGLNVSLDTKFYHKAVVDTADGAPLPGQATGRLIAFDPLTMSEVWGIDMPLHYNGGLLSTEAGLLMQTDATGYSLSVTHRRVLHYSVMTFVLAASRHL